MGEISVFSNCIILGSSWAMIICNTIFSISVAGDREQSSTLKSNKIYWKTNCFSQWYYSTVDNIFVENLVEYTDHDVPQARTRAV